MKEAVAGTIPGCHAAEIRRLVHDLSNALEIVVQTNYLLKSAKLDESSQQWLGLMDNGVRQATEISASLRKYVVENAAGK
jgi:hypothetical protein